MESLLKKNNILMENKKIKWILLFKNTKNKNKDYKSKHKKTVKNATGPKKKFWPDQMKIVILWFSFELQCTPYHNTSVKSKY